MAEARASLGFAKEPRAQLVGDLHLVGDHLQGHGAVQAGIVSLEDGPHASAADALEDVVFRELLDHRARSRTSCAPSGGFVEAVSGGALARHRPRRCETPPLCPITAAPTSRDVRARPAPPTRPRGEKFLCWYMTYRRIWITCRLAGRATSRIAREWR